MRKNLARVTLLSAVLAMSFSSVASSFADYNDLFKGKPKVDNEELTLGSPKGKVEKVEVKNTKETVKAAPGQAIDLIVGGFKAKSTVTIKVNGAPLPAGLTVDANGKVDTKGLKFKKPGTYYVEFTDANGKRQTTKFVVKKP